MKSRFGMKSSIDILVGQDACRQYLLRESGSQMESQGGELSDAVIKAIE